MTIVSFEETLRHDLPCLSAGKVTELAAVLEQLVAMLRPEAIYVFGSQARGDARPDSDIDLLVVVPPTDIPGYRLDQMARRALRPYALAFDLIVMPTDEFAWRRRSPASLPSTVLREGKLIYCRNEPVFRVETAPSRPYAEKGRASMQPESLREAQEWVVRAELDLKGAQALFQQTPPLLARVAYHTQQAAEKALKGFLTAYEQPFEKSHELEPLVQACCAIDPEFVRFAEAAQLLSPYAARFRYPGGPLEPSLAEASEAYESALQIVSYVQSRLALLRPES